MPEYEIVYRLYSSAEIKGLGKIGNAEIRSGGENSSVDGKLKFTVQADSKSEASQKAKDEIQDEARTIAGLLSLVSEEGVILGQAYPAVEVDRRFKSRTDWTGQLDDLSYEIADGLFEAVNSEFAADDPVIRALHWYGIGLNTETPEDRFIAFWTGLEAIADQQVKYSGEKLEAYEEAKDSVQEIVGEYEDLHNDLMSPFGFGKKESIAEALIRIFVEELDVSIQISDIEGETLADQIGELKDARVAIIHRGESVENADAKARGAKKLLREYLDESLDDAFLSLIDAETTVDTESDRSLHPVIDAEAVLEKVFENTGEETLSEEEVRKRAFALFRDYREVYRFQLEELVGLGKPLAITPQGEFRYAPTPEWVSNTHEAVLQYLYAAGRVPVEVITENINNGEPSHVRNDIQADEETIRECCGQLADRSLLEAHDEEYAITIDGRNVVQGKIDIDQF